MLEKNLLESLKFSLLFLISIFIISSCATKDGIPDGGALDDRIALMIFYEDITGGKEKLTNWDTELPLKEWKGVETNTFGRVTKLNLKGLDLSGRISESIGKISKLRYFDISKNSFTGVFPSQLAALDNLVNFIAGDNKFEGGVPIQYNNMKSIVVIDLRNNVDLKGDLPELWCDIGGIVNVRGTGLTPCP